MKTAKLIVSAAFALLAFPVTNARAFFECFEPPRGQPPAPAAQRVDCESATGQASSKTRRASPAAGTGRTSVALDAAAGTPIP